MPSGDKYDGPFKDDKPHGIAIEHKNGQIFKNEYREGHLVGEVDPTEENPLEPV